jgi:hypothetical protein
MKVALRYSPNRSQRPFHASPARYKLLLGAAGSGKTVALVMEDILEAMDYPGSQGVIFRRYYPSLRDTTKKTFLEMCPPELIAREIKSEGREEVEFINRSKTIFRVLDDYKKLGSMAFDRVKIDEAIEIEEREFMALIARMRGKIGPRRICLATNPPDEDHWLYRWFVERPSDDKRVFHSSTYDNADNLTPDYLHELEQYPPAWKEKFLYGRWGFLSEGQPVFEDFHPEIHVGTLAIEPGLKVIRGWDFGYVHPACIWLQHHPGGHIFWLRELLGTNVDLRTFANEVLRLSKLWFPDTTEWEDYCDIAGTYKNDRAPTSAQILRSEFNIPTYARKYSVHFTVERMRGLLRTEADGQRLLQIDESCRLSRRAFAGGYHMDQKKDEPAKDGFYDNVVDAGRYPITAVTMGFGTDPAAQKFAGKKLPEWRFAI